MLEDWFKDLTRMVDDASVEVERVLADWSAEMEQAVDSVVQSSNELAQLLEKSLTPEVEQFFEGVDRYVEELAEPLVLLFGSLEEAVYDSTEPIGHTVEPILNDHPACVGCRNYHGQVYGGNLLVCAMHPYGWTDEQCPDWVSTWSDR